MVKKQNKVKKFLFYSGSADGFTDSIVHKRLMNQPPLCYLAARLPLEDGHARNTQNSLLLTNG
jgi:hypothetical protein